MALGNPVEVLTDVFTRGFRDWRIFIVLIIALVIWVWIRNRDMQERTGEGFFDNMTEGDWDPREWFK